MKNILVTGCAGFIGSHVSKKLCDQGYKVIGIDNLNDYYDVRLKEWRLQQISNEKSFSFVKADIEDRNALNEIFAVHNIDAVINLAARAGVGASLKNPYIYVSTNVNGTLNLLELCRKYDVKKFILASTSSLYAGKEMPFKENVATTTPISPYAATKGGAEALAYSYHFLYGIDVTVVRYFTVYGPAGRPDMSIFRFIKWAMENKPLIVNGDGSQSRDFSYVEDVAEGTICALKNVGYEIINLGSDSPHSINEVISIVEGVLDKKVTIIKKPFPKEDVKATWADINKAKRLLGWSPKVKLSDGLERSVAWAKNNEVLMRKINL